MLVVLSEMNCLNKLRALGVYPDIFYTDEDVFREQSAMFSDATVIVIFGGNFRFNKRALINIIKGLMKRQESESDFGIKAIHVFSDSTISGLYAYYKYSGTLGKVDVMRGWNVVKKGVFPWTKLQTPEKETKMIMSKYHMSDSYDLREKYKAEKGNGVEDMYVKLIKVPTVKNGVISVG